MPRVNDEINRLEESREISRISLSGLNYTLSLIRQIRIIILFFCMTTDLLASETGSLFRFDFSKNDPNTWIWTNCIYSKASNGVKVYVKKKEIYGVIHRTIAQVPADYFLQVKLGDIENAASTPYIASIGANGKKFGRLQTGWNTFSMVNHANQLMTLGLVQYGSPTKDRGTWVDYEMIRIVKKPVNGLIVKLKDKPLGSNAVLGDTLIFSYYAGNSIAKSIPVKIFIQPGMLECRLNTEKKIELIDNEGDGIYVAEVKIDKNATAIKTTGSKMNLIAVVNSDYWSSYFTFPFDFDIKTSNLLEPALCSAANEQVREYRNLWFNSIKGKNLALGKKVVIFPAPDYSLTKDANDEKDLTDGQLTSRGDDKLWFDRKAIGWYSSGNVKNFYIDLGKNEQLKTLVIRCLGGTKGDNYSNFKYPAKFEVYISRDGKTYHLATSLAKLMPGEARKSDFKKFYYLPEKASGSRTRVYPFELTINAEARYVILKLTGETDWVFCDEMALIEADKKSDNYNQAYKKAGISIPMKGLIIQPRLPQLAFMSNIPAPQRFNIEDMRDKKERKKTASLVIELPEAISLVNVEEGVYIKRNNQKYIRYTIPLKTLSSPTVYLMTDTLKKSYGHAYIYALSGDQKQPETSLPIKVVTAPLLKPFKRLHISLAWMAEKQAMNWPDFFTNWRKLGFNCVSVFPRYWNPNNYKNFAKFVDNAHENNFKVIMNESPIHYMGEKQETGSKVFCQYSNGEKRRDFCPSYRGKFFTAEMNRIAQCVKMSRPDFVFFDIECWHNAFSTAPRCSRCIERQKKSGKNMEEYLYDCGSELMKELKAKVAQGADAAKIKRPVIGCYDRQPLIPTYAINIFQRDYPEFIDMAQPSLYVGGRAQEIHENIRANYKLMKNKKIIPWLTTGCYGEFDSYKIEFMVLEAFLNGAGGITYFEWINFTDSPLDFYYHVKALALLQPYEDLIADGEISELKGSNPGLTYSAIRRGNEMLLLVGNYSCCKPSTAIELPFKPKVIKDLRENKTYKTAEENFKVTVAAENVKLFYLKGM